MDTGQVMEMEKNGWKRINRTLSYTGLFPKMRSQGVWERADPREKIVVLF